MSRYAKEDVVRFVEGLEIYIVRTALWDRSSGSLGYHTGTLGFTWDLDRLSRGPHRRFY